MYVDPLESLNQSIQRDVAAGRIILRSMSPPPISPLGGRVMHNNGSPQIAGLPPHLRMDPSVQAMPRTSLADPIIDAEANAASPISPLGRRVLSPFGRRRNDSPEKYASGPLVASPLIAGLPPHPRMDPLVQAMPRMSLADPIIDAEANVVNRCDALAPRAFAPQDIYSRDFQREVADVESALVALEAVAHNHSAPMQGRHKDKQHRSRATDSFCRPEEMVENHLAFNHQRSGAEANVVNNRESLAPQDNYSRGFQREVADADAAVGSALVALEAAAHSFSAAMQKRHEDGQNRGAANNSFCRLEEVVENHLASLVVLQKAVRASQECKAQAKYEAEQASRQVDSDEASEQDSRAGLETAKQQHEESIKALQEASEEMRIAEVEFVKAQEEECEALQEADDAIAMQAYAAEAMTRCKIFADQNTALALEARSDAQRNAHRYGDKSGLAFAARAASNSSMSKQLTLKAEMDSFLKGAMADEAQQIAISTINKRAARQQDFEEKARRYHAAVEKERSDQRVLCECKQKHDEDMCRLQESKKADALAGQTYHDCEIDLEKRENEESGLCKVRDSALAALEEAQKTRQQSLESCERADVLCAESGCKFARQRQRFIHVRKKSGKCLDLEKLRRYDEALRRLDDVFLQGPTSPSHNCWPLVVDTQAIPVQTGCLPKPRKSGVNGLATPTERVEVAIGDSCPSRAAKIPPGLGCSRLPTAWDSRSVERRDNHRYQTGINTSKVTAERNKMTKDAAVDAHTQVQRALEDPNTMDSRLPSASDVKDNNNGVKRRDNQRAPEDPNTMDSRLPSASDVKDNNGVKRQDNHRYHTGINTSKVTAERNKMTKDAAVDAHTQVQRALEYPNTMDSRLPSAWDAKDNNSVKRQDNHRYHTGINTGEDTAERNKLTEDAAVDDHTQVQQAHEYPNTIGGMEKLTEKDRLFVNTLRGMVKKNARGD